MPRADQPRPTRSPVGWRHGAPVAVVVLVALSGCTVGSDDSASASPQEAMSQEATSQERSSQERSWQDEASREEDSSQGSAGSSGAGVREFDPDDVLVQQEVALSGSPDDRVTWGVQSLAVEGEVMVLRMVATPDFASKAPTETISLFEVMESAWWQPTLVDRENLTEYSLVTDAGRTWSSRETEVEAVNGEPFPVWGVFAAPPEGVDVLDLRLSDDWPEFTDVPVSR